MKFEEIYEPISSELNEVEAEIKKIYSSLGGPHTQEVFKYFFSIPGKYLRPTLVLLAALAVNDELTAEAHGKMIQLATAIELVHSASLIHDDIIDGDLLRRGIKTVNNTFGRKVAILAGDTLFSRAQLIFSSEMPQGMLGIISEVIEGMSLSEIDQARIDEPSRDEYLDIIKGKTAILMSACCKLAAALTSTDKDIINNLGEFGLNLGMTYQIVDDYMDGDANALRNVTMEDAQEYASRATKAISCLKDSVYKDNLTSFLSFLLNFSHANVKSRA